ncbi:PIR Superfamily Protein [Plasmodium ovale wallikeri]|uniref:PIR Superfamily Protein n=1 Tax=Plasmodium ovale wallikeri TaxID=864142 RepID=A0A1A9AGZ1_PLAOA|nr:PIR Superfamily Protein [Plasmodium ovale wallikeri]
MTPKGPCTKTNVLVKGTLPSGVFLNILYKNYNYIEKLNADIESYKSDKNPNNIISTINEQFQKIFKDIEDYFNNDDDIEMCCRNINFYFDLLKAVIKKPNVFSKDVQDNLTGIVEEKWSKIPKVRAIDICKGETYLDSMRKRCILKHLHDLALDKDFIKVNPSDYKLFLKEKWEKILGYTNPELGGLYIKIESDSIGIIEKYSNFLYSSDYICEGALNKLSPDDITVSTDMKNLINNISLDEISSNNINKACYNESYIEMLKIKTSSIQRMNNLLSIGIALLGFSLILIFLYRFSPLGSMLRRYKNKKNEVDENTSEEFPELYENTENIERLISYTSVSH